ncbi:ornithine cyclodeaminase family protein [Bacillus sp. 03113]|uniref:ornithine cyclodeaminase family protein n=1 Tax=Bacillus sp. 03113 TaxID=2578211 RepID=UPI001C65DFC5|nr:ornithine cyclodeaminase family protein [Bacillus sp. 03113]
MRANLYKKENLKMETLLLNKEEVGSLVDLDAILEAVEVGYRSFNSGLVVQPDFMAIELPGTHKGIDFKGGLDMNGGYMTLKASSGGYDNNPKLGLPIGMNTVMLFEDKTSALKCIMDGTWITGCRTGAAGAISVKYLARAEAEKLCIIGAGNQARRQLRAIMRVRKLTEVRVCSASPQFLDTYVKEMSEETGLQIYKCATAEEAVRGADIVVTTTRGRSGPIVKKEWVQPGTHIVAIGADMPDKQELYADVFAGAKVVNDSIPLCVKSGETHNAVKAGIIRTKDIHAEIGEIILGKKSGRESEDEVTIFDTVGMAIQDNVTVAMLYKAALEQGLGTRYEFFK